jgi:hypothetical protein
LLSCSDLLLKYWGFVHRSSNQNLASIQPPLDSHGQNLLLHSIELKHHIRKMMLMKMAAQHQQAGGSVSNLDCIQCRTELFLRIFNYYLINH